MAGGSREDFRPRFCRNAFEISATTALTTVMAPTFPFAIEKDPWQAN
jgi:hypothetical protein